jgi:hypothetical protein
MSSNPAEQEKYSLDEMLDRLQSNKSGPEGGEAGELVTRADGSQAIKVRKRKRRSSQPHKEAVKRTMRLRAIQVSSAVILTILLGLTLGALVLYVNSAPYRTGLLAKLNTATGAKTELHQLRVTPTGSNASQARLEWPEGNQIKSLTLNGIHAKALLGGVLGGHWGVDEISASSGTMRVGAQAPGEPLRHHPKHSGKSPIGFERMSVGKLDLTVGAQANPALEITKTEAIFYPNEGSPSVRLFRGDVKIPGWPLFRLDRSLLEIKENNLEIVTLRLLHELDHVGNIELSGTFDPAATSKEQKLGVKMSSFNLNGIAGTSLGYLIAGHVDSRDTLGENHLTVSGTSGGKLKVAFASAPNTFPKLHSFPFLGKLTKLTDNPWFAEPLFQDGCTGVLERDFNTTSIRDLSAISRNQLWITGDLSVQTNDVLSGTLSIGLPEASIVAARNPRLQDIFKESRDGFRWITLKISGTGSRPIDNFDEVAGSVRQGATDPSEGDLFDRLTQPKD